MGMELEVMKISYKVCIEELSDIKENMYSAVLDCGLKVYVQRKEGYANKYGVIASDFGSINNRYVVNDTAEEVVLPDGIAHFLEHKLFEEEYGSVEEKFSSIGASTNAFTNHTMTGYLFSCVDMFEESLELLLSFVSNPHFTNENVEKEKGIIAQEIRMYDDDPDWCSFSAFLNAMYHECPVRIDIAGSVESISKIDKGTLYDCYNTFYHPTNMTLFIVGDVDPEKTIELTNSIMNKLPKPDVKPVSKVMPVEPDDVRDEYANLSMEVSESILYLGYKAVGSLLDEKDRLKNIVIGEMLSDLISGSSSDFYQKLYEDGLIDKDFGAFFELEKEYGFFAFAGKTRDPKELEKRINIAIEEFLSLEGSNQAIERIRKNMVGENIKSFNSLEYIAYNFLTYELKNISLYDRIKTIFDVSMEEVMEFARTLFVEGRRVVTVVEPKK